MRYLGITERSVDIQNEKNAKHRLIKQQKYTDKYKVVVIVGSNQIHYLRIWNKSRYKKWFEFKNKI